MSLLNLLSHGVLSSGSSSQVPVCDDVNAILASLTGTAFMLVVSQEIQETLEDSGLYEKIQKFVQVHRNCFLMLQAPVFGKKEWEIMAAVQTR